MVLFFVILTVALFRLPPLVVHLLFFHPFRSLLIIFRNQLILLCWPFLYILMVRLLWKRRKRKQRTLLKWRSIECCGIDKSWHKDRNLFSFVFFFHLQLILHHIFIQVHPLFEHFTKSIEVISFLSLLSSLLFKKCFGHSTLKTISILTFSLALRSIPFLINYIPFLTKYIPFWTNNILLRTNNLTILNSYLRW